MRKTIYSIVTLVAAMGLLFTSCKQNSTPTDPTPGNEIEQPTDTTPSTPTTSKAIRLTTAEGYALPENGMVQVEFSNAKGSEKVSILFYTNKDVRTLPEGTYMPDLSGDRDPLTYEPDYAKYYRNGNWEVCCDGSIEVSIGENGKYEIQFHLTDNSDRPIEYSFNGDIELQVLHSLSNTELPNQPEWDFAIDTIRIIKNEQQGFFIYVLQFCTLDDGYINDELRLYLFAEEYAERGVTAGTYTVDGTYAPLTVWGGYYSSEQIIGSYAKSTDAENNRFVYYLPSAGTLTVTNDGVHNTFVGSFTTDKGNSIKLNAKRYIGDL